MARGPTRIHIANGPHRVLCGLPRIVKTRDGEYEFPTANPRLDYVTCKNCLADYNGVDRIRA